MQNYTINGDGMANKPPVTRGEIYTLMDQLIPRLQKTVLELNTKLLYFPQTEKRVLYNGLKTVLEQLDELEND